MQLCDVNKIGRETLKIAIESRTPIQLIARLINAKAGGDKYIGKFCFFDKKVFLFCLL